MNSIESNFVPYQIALDMKSIGFNEPCMSSKDMNNGQGLIQIPLYQQAFRWFREKHGWLQIIIGEGLNGNLIRSGDGYGYSILEEGWINFYDSLDESVIYETYEEAELACLKKLIKIVNER
jgi:hypothetical protein